MLTRRTNWKIAFAAMLGTLGCAAANAGPADRAQPAEEWVRVGKDSVVSLLHYAPADSVVLHRGGGTILLSMRDVEAHFAQWALSAETVQFRDRMRQEIERQGWVQLGEGMPEDLLAAKLIERGRAAVRRREDDRLLPSVRIAREEKEMGTTVIEHRLIFTPDGKLLLRVPYSVTLS